MSAARIGILAEDATDCDALQVLVRRIAGEHQVGLRAYSFAGCARLRQKAASTMKSLAREGCVAVILVHDLDRNPRNGELNDEATLRRALSKIDVPSTLHRLVCIPVEELEAWFWADPGALAMIEPGTKAHHSPHLIRQPKEKLVALSRGVDKKSNFRPAKNKELAAKLDMDLCASRCPAFRDLRDFVLRMLSTFKVS